MLPPPGCEAQAAGLSALGFPLCVALFRWAQHCRERGGPRVCVEVGGMGEGEPVEVEIGLAAYCPVGEAGPGMEGCGGQRGGPP
jgi:hypothetical protein